MGNVIEIGTWHEKAGRKLTQHTSYAADWIIHQTKPGDYPAKVSIEGGYNIPMPYWLLVKIDTEITDGYLYSGFGGVNFGRSKVTEGSSHYTIQAYISSIPKLVAEGVLELKPEYEFFNQSHEGVLNYIKENGLP